MRTTWLKLVGCHCDAWPCQCGLSAATALTDSPGWTAGRDGARLDRLTGESDRRAVQWMNESLAKGANGQQSCWHTDHTQPHTHSTTCCHTHIQCHTHTHGTLTRAQRLQFRVARLDLALLWCFAAYFMACWAHCVFASYPLPVTDLFAFPFVCLPPSPPRLALFHSPLCTYHTQPCFNLHKKLACRLPPRPFRCDCEIDF